MTARAASCQKQVISVMPASLVVSTMLAPRMYRKQSDTCDLTYRLAPPASGGCAFGKSNAPGAVRKNAICSHGEHID